MRTLSILTLLAIATACGPKEASDGGIDAGDGGLALDAGDGGSAADAGDGGSGDGGDAGFLEAAHDAFPQIPYGGGPVLTHPQLVTVTFPGLAIAAQAKGYDDWVASSAWLAQVGRDYGVGNGPAPLEADLDGGPPPWSGSADIAAFLSASFDGGALPPPSPDGGQLYVLFLPPDAPLSGLCTAVFGFHAQGLYQGLPFAFAIVPDCPAAATGYPDPEGFELVASHEILEAATNPYPAAAGGGWQLVDPSDPWWAPGFGEVADVCEGQIWQAPDGGPFAQRIWSNSQAALGTGSPCLPTPAAPYFNVSPTPDAPLTIAAGASRTVPITGWSTAAVQPWELFEMAYFGDFDPAPIFADAGIDNGETQNVLLSVPAGTPPGSRTQLWIGSYAAGASDYTSFWPVAVVSQ
ncbi:MAG: hypothetical protein ACYDCL_18170 [Myxococcales bacterium]